MFIAGGLVLVVAAIGSALFDELEPSPELLRVMAGIGASFFLAYVIEATWILGILMGLAAAGLLGVILALILSERPAGESFGRAEDVNFWLSAVSLTGLGLLVALQPGVTHIWLQEDWKNLPSDPRAKDFDG
jgi:hypothetical protein